MKLNLDVIADWLPAHYHVKRYGSRDRSLTYGRPLLYEAGTETDPGRVYLAVTDFLPDPVPEDAALICVGGRIPRNLPGDGCRILHIEDSADIMEVFRDVQAVYDLFDAWDEEMRDILEAPGEPDMRRFLETGVRILRNRIGISDYGLHLMFSCDLEEGKARFRDLRDSQDGFDMTSLEGIRDVCLVEREIQTPYLSAIPRLTSQSYCQNVYSFGHYMGCAHITVEEHPFRESDYPLMDRFLGYFCRMALRYFSTTAMGDSPETAVIRDILNGRMPQSTRLRQIRLAPGESWVCLKIREKQGARYLPHNYMCEQLRMLLPDRIHVLQYGDGIVGILHREAEPAADADAELEDLLQRMGYACGMSNPFREITLLTHYHEQASFALECSLEDGSPDVVSPFGDKMLRYMLSGCTGTMPRNVLCPPGLLRLLEHDLKKGSDHIRTLRVYLDNESNASRSAEQLYVHRNSFLKRLERIAKILDMDLEDPDTRLLLRICLRLMEFPGA